MVNSVQGGTCSTWLGLSKSPTWTHRVHFVSLKRVHSSPLIKQPARSTQHVCTMMRRWVLPVRIFNTAGAVVSNTISLKQSDGVASGAEAEFRASLAPPGQGLHLLDADDCAMDTETFISASPLLWTQQQPGGCVDRCAASRPSIPVLCSRRHAKATHEPPCVPAAGRL